MSTTESRATGAGMYDELPEPETVLRISALSKSFGEINAVAGASLELHRGELCALIGPSGCGKTTMLRLIAGLERPDAGSIELEGALISGDGVDLAPQRRRIGMVFQDFALFPHLDVGANVAYGLGRRADERRVDEMLALVGLAGAARRPVHELSGGQQQRVAIARALAPSPKLILLDEPFSNLDAALRQQMRDEVRAIILHAGVTALFVTHDQEEALSISDRVAVIRDGRIVQLGTPEEIYSRPTDRWTAEFLGEVEVLDGEAEGSWAKCELGTVPVRDAAEGPVAVMLRPEAIALDANGPPDGRPSVVAEVVSRRYFGHDQLVEVELPSKARVRSRCLGLPAWHPGDRVRVWLDGPAAVFADGGAPARDAP
ncbi:MAG TPA: ABC transporter ATP-binding protein [Solirubrobacterales bacterium]|nr:ABC transporter ATP-binding protein [Solirubrobacterales bacterium]